MNPSLQLGAVLVAFALGTGSSISQPSGGPYGPQPQTYEVPANAKHVFYASPGGVATASGAVLGEPTTIESAIQRAVTGDAIILRGGIYRIGGLVLNQGITIQPYRDEQPVLNGTKVATHWTSLPDGVWRTKWDTLFPSKPMGWWNEKQNIARTPLHRFNDDMVFVDGVSFRSVGSLGELDDTSFYIDYDEGSVHLRVNPTNRLVEITAWNSALVCTPKRVHDKDADHKGPTIRGITFTQYAFRALEVEGKRGSVPSWVEPTDDPIGLADPATFGKDVVGTTLEHVTITHCSRVAGYFRGDNLVIRNCLVSDTSTEGIYVIGSSDCILERNIVTRNNAEKITGYYVSAVKIFNQTRRVIFRNNLVANHQESAGVWYDVGNRDGIFINNWIEGVQIGLFFEISQGIICAGNVFVNCDTGIHVLNAADSRIHNNTFWNSTVYIDRNERSAVGDVFAWHSTTGPAVDKREGHILEGNLFLRETRLDRLLVRIEQSKSVFGKLTRPLLSGYDANTYVRPASSTAPLITYGPVPETPGVAKYDSLDKFRAAQPKFEPHGVSIDASPREVVRGVESKRFDPIQPIERAAGAPALPEDVRMLLGWTVEQARTVGAYPAGQSANAHPENSSTNSLRVGKKL